MFVVKLSDENNKQTYVYETYSKSDGRTLVCPTIDKAKRFKTKSGAMSCCRSKYVNAFAQSCGYTKIAVVEVKE